MNLIAKLISTLIMPFHYLDRLGKKGVTAISTLSAMDEKTSTLAVRLLPLLRLDVCSLWLS
jgi:hypothetical protein